MQAIKGRRALFSPSANSKPVKELEFCELQISYVPVGLLSFGLRLVILYMH